MLLIMKTDAKKQLKEKEFDTVKTFRAIKKISKYLLDIHVEQIRAYLKDKKVRLHN